jgi:hypothetical protein
VGLLKHLESTRLDPGQGFLKYNLDLKVDRRANISRSSTRQYPATECGPGTRKTYFTQKCKQIRQKLISSGERTS